MTAKVKKLLFLAEPFGFGPISSTIAVARQVKKLDPSIDCLFLGRGTSLQLAERSNVFDAIVSNNNIVIPPLADILDEIGPENCLVVSNTYPEGVSAAKRDGFRSVFIDTLFWMWNEIPVDLSSVEAYFIEEFHCVDFKEDRFGNSSKFKKTPPLIDVDVTAESVRHPFVLVSFGGIDSDLYGFPGFYDKLIRHIATDHKFRNFEVLICGGGLHISGGSFSRFENASLRVKCLGPTEYMANLRAADYVLSSPGLHGFYESYYLRKNTIFLPPQNYSQYLQLKYIKSAMPEVMGINFEDLGIQHNLREVMPAEERIAEVKRLRHILEKDAVLEAIFSRLEQFCVGQYCTDWSCRSEAFLNDRTGPQIVAHDLLVFEL